MKFINLRGDIAKGRRQISGSSSIQDEEVKDPAKLAEILRQTVKRLTELEARIGQEPTEFEVEMGSSPGDIYLNHGFGDAVRWYVTYWTGTSPHDFHVSIKTTTDILVLTGSVPGHGVIRVEPSQYVPIGGSR